MAGLKAALVPVERAHTIACYARAPCYPPPLRWWLIQRIASHLSASAVCSSSPSLSLFLLPSFLFSSLPIPFHPTQQIINKKEHAVLLISRLLSRQQNHMPPAVVNNGKTNRILCDRKVKKLTVGRKCIITKMGKNFFKWKLRGHGKGFQ